MLTSLLSKLLVCLCYAAPLCDDFEAESMKRTSNCAVEAFTPVCCRMNDVVGSAKDDAALLFVEFDFIFRMQVDLLISMPAVESVCAYDLCEQLILSVRFS